MAVNPTLILLFLEFLNRQYLGDWLIHESIGVSLMNPHVRELEIIRQCK